MGLPTGLNVPGERSGDSWIEVPVCPAGRGAMEATGEVTAVESRSADRGGPFDRERNTECITMTSGTSEARPDSRSVRIRERIVLFSKVL